MTHPPTIQVDFVGVTRKEEVHDRLATAFGFPDYYGKNWDAFWDCVTMLDPMPQKIRIRGMKVLADVLPREETLLRKCLEDLRAIPEASALVLDIE